ncbi:thyroid adenoma-associated protein homolog isoform X2 [Aplysia californica]|uniref:tRNA (32-2'-O)-methyltransferase regulator THADA n=1 Tax=Aplysia californica TaxID=6500 RepID=A0ABM1VYV7_APLCA|nr:thyroid adenoma-associated protein homolog isoform X2 [Aplysia californica]
MESLLQTLYPPTGTKIYLAKLKKVIEHVKTLSEQQDKNHALCHLVSVYLDCPARTPAQRVTASFFEGLDSKSKSQVEKWLCDKLLVRLSISNDAGETTAQKMRHTVDTVAALLENFKLGEKCVSTVAFHIVQFLVKAEEFFLPQVNADVPPVRLNEVMHHCHVTLQTLNLVLQKTVTGSAELVKQLVAADSGHLVPSMFQLDLRILNNELFLLDCRCCSAMNALIMIKLAIGKEQGSALIPSLIIPTSETPKESALTRPSWLNEGLSQNLNLDQQSVLAFLALAFGYIATMEVEEALKCTETGKCFFVDMFLTRLLQHGLRCTDTISKALYGKTVNLFTTKLLSAAQGISVTSSVNAVTIDLRGESPTLQCLLDYVWTHWEDQLDVIRQSAKIVFENVLKIHTTVAPEMHNKEDSFLQSLLQHLFTVSWTSRGKFGALTSCGRLVGAQTVLTLRPELPTEVVQQLQEQASSCYASELYSALFTQHLQDLSTSSSNERGDGQTDQTVKEAAQNLGKSKNVPDKSAVNALSKLGDDKKSLFHQTWMLPVVRALTSSNKKLKQNIIEYLLPRLLKVGDQVLSYMVQKLSSNNIVDDSVQTHPHHGAIIMCLRRARVMGLLKSASQSGQSESSGFLWYGQLDPIVLRSALCSLDEQIRLDAFALVIENHKTTEAITSFEFEMIKFFLPTNLNNQSPAFRQAVVALMKKFFFRVKESCGALNRLVKKSDKLSPAHASRQNYQDFLDWLSGHLLGCLYPGSAFAYRTCSLAILSLMTTFFSTESDGYSLPSFLSDTHLHTLLECLSDTFEENKKEALKILTAYMTQVGPVWNPDQLREALVSSMTLACSTRPQDCGTAAYFFLTLMRQQQLHPDTFDLSQLLPSISHLWASSSIPSSMTSSPKLFLLPVLVSLLNDQIAVAQHSLITAAANRPMYPTLHCIRFILHELDFRTLTPEMLPSVRDFIASLIHSCLNLSTVVSPVVQNSSPEGNVPEDAILGPGLNVGGALPIAEDLSKDSLSTPSLPNLEQSVELSRALVESMPEYLVVCCWRSIKEVSLTLGKMCLQIPVTLILEKEKEGSLSLLTLDQVLTIGDHFTQQLLESIHRGAFELAYAGFQLLCQMLWSHPAPAFHQLPAQWLSQVMADIQSKDPNSRLCSTRRSAGVPFFVQAIASSEPSTTGRKCFHGVMKELLAIALPDDNQREGTETDDAQVHSLNILRALFRDARLGEDVVPYTADGLKAAVLGFKSDEWAVRNSATLLLSALMTRMFGVKRSKDETAMSKKNCQTGRLFFHRYPSLYPFLLSELEAATANVGSSSGLHLHPSLYPVLLVLGRLFPSTLEGSDTSLSLAAFIPYVLKCAASPVLKTRLIAARALRPLARKTQVIDISSHLMANVPVSPDCQAQPNSYIHGSLLQLTELVPLVKSFNQNLKSSFLTSLVPLLLDRVWILSSTNKCFVTRQAGLEFASSLLDIGKSLSVSVPFVDELLGHFVQAISADHDCLSHSSTTLREMTWQPWFYEYQKTQARLCLKYLSVLNTPFQNNLVQSSVTKEDLSLRQENIANSRKNCLSEISNKAYVRNSSGSMSLTLSVSSIKNLLGSSFYEVRLEVLDALLEVLKNSESLHSGHPITNSEDEESRDVEFSGQELQQDEVWTGDVEGGGSSLTVAVGWTAEEIRCLFRDLTDFLLEMAERTETHHRCQEKVFLVLASVPEVMDIISRRNSESNLKMFSTLIEKLRAERRIEVKAAVLMFSSCVIPFLYSQLSSENPSVALGLLQRWVQELQSGCVEEESTDFQMACCHVLLHNAERLLGSTLEKTSCLTFQCWDILATLLQEDDLEVKDKAADVLCAVVGLEFGSYHPSHALHLLPEILLSIHRDQHLSEVVKCLVSWVLADCGSDVKESSERLFDKGEMNTYWDQVTFTRSITTCLARLFSISIGDGNSRYLYQPAAPSSLQDRPSPSQISQLLKDSNVEEFFVQSASCVVKELGDQDSKCQKLDRLLNPVRYGSLCQTVFRGRVLVELLATFTTDDCAWAEVKTAVKILNDAVNQSVKKFQLVNVLCGTSLL